MRPCGITRRFRRLPPCRRQLPHVFLTRPPRKHPEGCPVRLACIRHAASVDPEPGSNSPPLCVSLSGFGRGPHRSPPAPAAHPDALLLPGSGLVKPSRFQPRPPAPPERFARRTDLPPCRSSASSSAHGPRLRSRRATCQTHSSCLAAQHPASPQGEIRLPTPVASMWTAPGCPCRSRPISFLIHFAPPSKKRRQTSLPDSPPPVKRPFSAPFRFGVARKQRDRYLTPLYFSFQARIGSGVRNSMYPGDAT